MSWILGASALGCALALGAGCGVERANVPHAVSPPPAEPAPWRENDSRAGLPGDPVQCPVVFEEFHFRATRQEHPEQLLGYRLQAQPRSISCDRPAPEGEAVGYERLRGYVSLYLYPRIEMTGDYELAPAIRGGEARAYLGYRELEVTDEVRRQLLDRLAFDPASADPATAIQVMAFAPDFALLPSGPRIAVSVERHSFARSGHAMSSLVLHFPAGLPESLGGAASAPALTLYSEHAGMDDPMRLLSWSGSAQSDAAVYDVARDLWQRAAGLPAARAPGERASILEDVTMWLRRAGADPAQSGTALADLVTYASQGWDPAPASGLRAGQGAELLRRLAFLTVAAPESDPVQRYGESVERLRPFYENEPAGEREEWLQEAVALSSHPYPIEREAWIMDAARAIQDGSHDASGSRAWQLAKRLSSRADQLDAPKAALVVRAADWLSGADGASNGPGLATDAALDHALEYVQQRALDETALQLVEDSYLWLVTYPGPRVTASNALMLAENYVFTQRMPRARLEILQAAYAWLADSEGPALAGVPGLVRAQTWVFTRAMTRAQWDSIRATYASLRAHGASPADALARAEAQAFPTR